MGARRRGFLYPPFIISGPFRSRHVVAAVRRYHYYTIPVPALSNLSRSLSPPVVRLSLARVFYFSSTG